ncbi:uncharacterized protein N7443_003152 [Penicillium atrosanguineum]|uniref:uncharacterized protein n=1 Tax=Penicillium atrosanguineum TaxID=1132637 RepID=UPI0023899C67|nr:uncharacterized protein N7443_003152 [Penicillium atrosanguineum]KAJ5310691.1 hypothetical protein N7443_003152 [Penicillium atrosanguineum]
MQSTLCFSETKLTSQSNKMKLQIICVLSFLTAVFAAPVQTQAEKRDSAGLIKDVLGDNLLGNGTKLPLGIDLKDLGL